METPVRYFLKSLTNFSKTDVRINFDGEDLVFPACEKIVISPSFFKSFSCKRCCVCCQKGISPLVYSDSDVVKMNYLTNLEDVGKLQMGLKQVPIQVNNEAKNIYLYRFQGFRCGFDKLTEGDDIWSCDLHFKKLKPILCLLPWVRIINSKGCTSLRKSPFGYAWAFGCRAKWEEEFNKEQFEGHDLEIIHRLISAAKDLGIDTYLPEVLTRLEDWFEDYNFGKHSIPKENLIIIDTKNKDKKFFI